MAAMASSLAAKQKGVVLGDSDRVRSGHFRNGRRSVSKQVLRARQSRLEQGSIPKSMDCAVLGYLSLVNVFDRARVEPARFRHLANS
jgi:hypothetical protein